MGGHFLFQGIFLIQGSNQALLHCRWILYCLSHQGSPQMDETIYIFTALFFLFGCTAQHVESLFPDQEPNVHPLQWKCRSLNHWTAREVL